MVLRARRKWATRCFFQSGERINHTGIVYAVKNGKIYTVEGNSSDQVAKREYALNATRIASGYGRPLYNNRGDDGKFVAAKEWCYLDASGARASGWIKFEEIGIISIRPRDLWCEARRSSTGRPIP